MQDPRISECGQERSFLPIKQSEQEGQNERLHRRLRALGDDLSKGDVLEDVSDSQQQTKRV
jgi:hypothetical protein